MNEIPRLNHWTQPSQTQTLGTAIVVPIEPHGGPGSSSRHLYSLSGVTSGAPSWYSGGIGVTHITHAVITSGSTAHTWIVLRPKNFTTIAEAVIKNDTTIVMADNPGLYATTYKYPLPAGVAGIPGMVADNTPASGDYCMFQLDNGAWHTSLISSLSTLTLTIATATPNVDGSGAAIGRILFFFAAAADKDPATGLLDPSWQPVVSATTVLGTGAGPIASGLRPGDPLILLNANATAASTLVLLSGMYGKP